MMQTRIDPKQFGKSGMLSFCAHCAKTTEYQICCDAIDGLTEITLDNIYELAHLYNLNIWIVDELEQAVGEYYEDKVGA
jgi:hypothetical protein